MRGAEWPFRCLDLDWFDAMIKNLILEFSYVQEMPISHADNDGRVPGELPIWVNQSSSTFTYLMSSADESQMAKPGEEPTLFNNSH